jgi:DNA-binding transcriptional LysR family regulator
MGGSIRDAYVAKRNAAYSGGENNIDITQIDIYALECLRLVVSERSVSKAADKLGISQPSMSNVIGRLRRVTGDPLIIRRPNGMEPTAFAEALVDTGGAFLDRLRELATRHARFDPSTSTRIFMLHAVDYVMATVVPRLMTRVRKEAPDVSVICGPLDLRTIRQALEDGTADFAITPTGSVPDTFYGTVLPPMKMVCIASATYPPVRDHLDLEEFAAAPHAALTFGDSHSPYLIERLTDDLLSGEGLSRFKAVQVSSVLALPAIVAESDLIAVIPADLAERAAKTYPIKIFPLPLERPAPQHMIVWHSRSISDPGSQWLRNIIRNLPNEPTGRLRI